MTKKRLTDVCECGVYMALHDKFTHKKPKQGDANEVQRSEHTPTPWKVADENLKPGDFPMIVTPEEERPKYAIAEVYPTGGQLDAQGQFNGLGNAKANAEFIVRAVNAHEELLGIAHAFVEHIQNCGSKPTPELLQAIAKAEASQAQEGGK